MEQLLWTFETIKPFAHHPDAALRHWAQDRLIKLFPEQAGEVMATMLADPGRFIAHEAIDFLGETGATEKYGPLLLEHLAQAEGDNFGRLALALARLNYRPALPLLLDYLREHGLYVIKLSGYSPMAQALGTFGGTEVRQTIWSLLEQKTTPEEAILPLIEALLQTAQPEDMARLLQYYRSLPDSLGPKTPFSLRSTPLASIAAGVQAGDLIAAMEEQVKNGFQAVLKQAEWWSGNELELTEAGLAQLEQAFKARSDQMPALLLAEAQHLATERGDDLAGWLTAWINGERPTGYRQRVLYTWLILQALAQLPSPPAERRQQENLLGLGLLAQWSAERDDQAFLEAAADKTEALLDILTAPNEHVLPDVIERVAALGPDISPAVIAMLDADDFDWGMIRVVKTIERLARLYPGRVDAAIPPLIDCIYDGQGDYLLQAAEAALSAIGPAAVPAITKQLRFSTDLADQSYLTAALAQIPVESAAQFILNRLKSGRAIEEIQLSALADIGSASAIEPLYSLWQPGDHILAETLLVLCELNGVTKPEIPEWRQLVVEQDARTSRIISGDFDFLSSLAEAGPPRQTKIRTWQIESKSSSLAGRSKKTAKTVSKKELKKRAAQRHSSRGKKKKGKR